MCLWISICAVTSISAQEYTCIILNSCLGIDRFHYFTHSFINSVLIRLWSSIQFLVHKTLFIYIMQKIASRLQILVLISIVFFCFMKAPGSSTAKEEALSNSIVALWLTQFLLAAELATNPAELANYRVYMSFGLLWWKG